MPKKKCLPCALHDGLTDEEAKMLAVMLGSIDDEDTFIDDAFFNGMMDHIEKDLRKAGVKEISTGGTDDDRGTMDKRFDDYVAVYHKLVRLLKGKGGRAV